MKRIAGALIAALVGVAPVAWGQHHQGQPHTGGPPPQTQMSMQQQQMHHHQEMAEQMNRMTAQVHELNQWMNTHQARTEFRGMGTQTEALCQRLQTMNRTMERLRQDDHMQSDPARRRDMDRIQDRLMVMGREMDEFQAGLRRASEGPPRTGDPPSSAEIQRMEQRRRELNARIEEASRRTNEMAKRMTERKARQEYQDLCREMGGAVDQLRLMERDMDRLESDGDFLKDRARLRETDRMHDRLKSMLREVEEAQATLEGAMGP